MSRALTVCLAFFLSLCMLCTLTACGSVRDDVPVQLIADAVGGKIDGYENLSPASDDYLRYCMKSDLSRFEEHLLLCPFAGNVYREIGIFKLAAGADRASALAELRGYLAFRAANWDMRYKAEECEKIKHARLVTRGRYCFFAILSDAERAAAEKAFADVLR